MVVLVSMVNMKVSKVALRHSMHGGCSRCWFRRHRDRDTVGKVRGVHVHNGDERVLPSEKQKEQDGVQARKVQHTHDQSRGEETTVPTLSKSLGNNCVEGTDLFPEDIVGQMMVRFQHPEDMLTA